MRSGPASEALWLCRAHFRRAVLEIILGLARRPRAVDSVIGHELVIGDWPPIIRGCGESRDVLSSRNGEGRVTVAGNTCHRSARGVLARAGNYLQCPARGWCSAREMATDRNLTSDNPVVEILAEVTRQQKSRSRRRRPCPSRMSP
jgi:hypothetical protein